MYKKVKTLFQYWFFPPLKVWDVTQSILNLSTIQEHRVVFGVEGEKTVSRFSRRLWKPHERHPASQDCWTANQKKTTPSYPTLTRGLEGKWNSNKPACPSRKKHIDKKWLEVCREAIKPNSPCHIIRFSLLCL